MKRAMAVVAVMTVAVFAAPVRAHEPAAEAAKTDVVPDAAWPWLVEVGRAVDEIWPEMSRFKSAFAAQIEQESCVTLKHAKCWSPAIELKTDKVYGFGLAQLTVVYEADGKTEKSNAFKEVIAKHASLADWKWEDRFDGKRQIRAMLVQLKEAAPADVRDERERLAFALASFNGGQKKVDSLRSSCALRTGCDPKRWFGHVELESTPDEKVVRPGYKLSFYEINRDYVHSVMDTRRRKYDAPMAAASHMPERAKALLPVLSKVVDEVWPEMKANKSVLAAQIEQETCEVLLPDSERCWNAASERKTEKEYEFGLGLITVKYGPDGKTETMNMFTEMQQLDPVLAQWKWEQRFDAAMQIRAFVLLQKRNDAALKAETAQEDRPAFLLSAYNGGLGHVLKDRALCKETAGCDPTRWFGNVEKFSVKSKDKRAGNLPSFYEANRSYVRDVLKLRRAKYDALLAATP